MSSIDDVVSQVSMDEWPKFDAAGKSIAARLDELQDDDEWDLVYSDKDGILRLFVNRTETLAIKNLSKIASAAVLSIFRSAIDGTCKAT